MINSIKNGYQIKKAEYDKSLLLTIIALLVIGFISVLSASIPMCISKNIFPLHFVIQHLFWIVLGSLGMIWFSKFDYKELKKYTFPFTFVVIILILTVKYTPLGMTINGARRWLNLGLFQFQPSEFSKLALIMLLGNLFSLKKERFILEFIKCFCVLGIMFLVVLKQPNLSMALLLLGITFFMYILSGKSLKPIYIGVIILLCFAGMIKMGIINIHDFLKEFQIERIRAFLNGNADVQGNGYQVFHSKIAISSGGLWGLGFGCSKEKLGWLPEAHTDFIFSVIAEEFGFWGSFLIISLFLTLFKKGIDIAMKCPTLYGKMLAFGITFSITMQAFFNISVASALLPATGITLPFISYGGSSLFVMMCMVGILLNISRYSIIRIINGKYLKQ